MLLTIFFSFFYRSCFCNIFWATLESCSKKKKTTRREISDSQKNKESKDKSLVAQKKQKQNKERRSSAQTKQRKAEKLIQFLEKKKVSQAPKLLKSILSFFWTADIISLLFFFKWLLLFFFHCLLCIIIT